MCGVVGTFSYAPVAPPVDRECLVRARDAMVARGPDGAGLWVSDDERVGLAHRRLAIIDLSGAAAQPMPSTDGTLQVVFNGEIYNHVALRRQLAAQGVHFRTGSDTEVLLALYQAFGQRMVEHLRGMYAFAIWDSRKQGLFLARDPFGIKPLYYADDGACLHFASQVKALLAGNFVPTTPEPAGHVGFYLWGYVPEPYTMYERIRALPAGTTLWLDRAGQRTETRHFDLALELREAEQAAVTLSDRESDERLRAGLLDSVRHHLVADVPVGIFLSSGADSAVLTALAAEASAGDLRTMTLGFKEFRGTPLDETQAAARIAERYGTRHQTEWVGAEDFHTAYLHLIEAMDQPSVDGVNQYLVSKVAAASGLKVALSGLGGDEIFGGYPSFRDIPRMIHMFGPMRHAPALGAGFRWVSAPVLKRLTSPKYAGLLEYGGTYSGAYMLRRGLFMPWELPSILDGDLVREGWDTLRPLLAMASLTDPLRTCRAKVAALELSCYMRSQLLKDADWAGMAHSLEVRVPLVDIALFRAMAPLMIQARPPGKADMDKLLPAGLLSSSKKGFVAPVREWLFKQDLAIDAPRGLRMWAHRIYNLKRYAI